MMNCPLTGSSARVAPMKPIPLRLLLSALLALVFAVPAAAALQGENLLVPPLAGWSKIYEGNGNGIRMQGFVPPGNTADVWSQMATIEVFLGRGGYPPRKLRDQVNEGLRLNCEALHVDDLGAGTVNGLPAIRWMAYCSKLHQYGKGEIDMFQAVSGKDNFFLVYRAWRGPAFDLAHPPVAVPMIKDWEQYMAGVAVCDSRDPSRPCP